MSTPITSIRNLCPAAQAAFARAGIMGAQSLRALLRLLSVVLALTSLTGPAPAAELPANLQQLHFPFEGHGRQFRIYIPDNIGKFPGPRPLVIALHGLASSDIRLIDKTRGQFMALADQYGFVVVYPNAILRRWDLGQGQLAALARPRRDDLAYLEHVIALAAGMAPIDPGRIYGVGFSQGAQMALALACTRPGLLRAIAMVAMTVPDFLAETCADAPAFGVLMIHGTSDPVVPYQGGQIRVGNRVFDRFLPFEHSLTLFQARNGCARTPDKTRHLDDVPEDDTSVLIRQWHNCRRAKLAAFTIIGGGHKWPHEPQAVRTPLGPVSREIYPAREIWRFFARQ